MNKRNLLHSKAFMQEYSVLKALAPESIINLFDAQEISLPEYYKLICMLTYLNFKELLHFHRQSPNYILTDEERHIFEKGNDEELEALIEKNGWELDDDEYVNLFKENLQSEGLIELFSALSD